MIEGHDSVPGVRCRFEQRSAIQCIQIDDRPLFDWSWENAWGVLVPTMIPMATIRQSMLCRIRATSFFMTRIRDRSRYQDREQRAPGQRARVRNAWDNAA